MRPQLITRAAFLVLVLGGIACAGNKSADQVGAAGDSTITTKVDSTTNQTESGVLDSAGQSTLGKGAEQTRPDQGQPVTAKGDTLNQGVDSANTGPKPQAEAAHDSTSASTAADSGANVVADSTANQTESGVTDSSGTSTLGKEVEQARPDQGQPVTSKGDTINQGVDSASTGR